MKRSTKSTQTRAKLFDTTGQLFRAQGFHATGIDDVLRLSGVPRGSLYHYFPGGKDQLTIETLAHVATQMQERMSNLLSSSDDPMKALLTLLDVTAKSLIDSDFRNGCPIAAVTLDAASERNSVRKACEQGLDSWLAMFTEHFKRAGLREKRAKTFATLVLAAIEGGLILSRAQKSCEPLTAIAEEFTHLMGVTKRAPRKPAIRKSK
jgi:TetR/AcrR family transcriptional regulator, lmrAB and yxaGH operons repressor